MAKKIIAFAAPAILAATLAMPTSVNAGDIPGLFDPTRFALNAVPAHLAQPPLPAGPARPGQHAPSVRPVGFKHFVEGCVMCHGG